METDRDTLPVVVFDLDSTLADTRHRRQYLEGITITCPEDWAQYHTHCLDDAPVHGTIQLARLLHPHHRITILTARPDTKEIREKTEMWLDLHQVMYDSLILLPLDEHRPTGEWKTDVVAKMQADGYDVALMVDDWGPNGRAIEAAGTPFLHIARPGTDVPGHAGT
jgi:hypothetical protein